MEYMALYLFITVCAIIMLGYPVAFSLAGASLLFALLGIVTGTFEPVFLEALPNRLFGRVMMNQTLIAVPLFIFMGLMLQASKVAEELLETMAMLFGPMRGGLGIAVVLVGALLAASTGIVGATVVTMGVLSLPVMLRRGYNPAVATGTISAAGTLGQIVPPSIILVLLADVLSSAYQQAQLDMGIFSPETVSVDDFFMGAVIPSLLLISFYIIYLAIRAWLRPLDMPAVPAEERAALTPAIMAKKVLIALIPPLLLIFSVLGSILFGIATITEAAAVGAVGATCLALLRGQFNLPVLKDVTRHTVRVTSMVFMILIGATVFALVFRGFGGEELVHELFNNMPGGVVGAMFVVMALMFVLGFVLDFIEITFVVVPVVGPILLAMGLDPIWLGIMIAVNLQTSFLTPPFGFALFYLRGVAPPEVTTGQIYRGVVPFILIQLCTLGLLAWQPQLVTWLPAIMNAQ